MIATEFKYHQTSCYKTFTKPDETTLNLLNLPNQNNDKDVTTNTGDFESVTKSVKTNFNAKKVDNDFPLGNIFITSRLFHSVPGN